MNKYLIIAIVLLGLGIMYQILRPKKIAVTVPPGSSEVEIPRREGREPFRFKINTPERKIIVEPK